MSTVAKNTAVSDRPGVTASEESRRRRQAAAIYSRLSQVIDPKPELLFGSVFELLIAVVLSAQATDRSVNAVTRRLFAQCRTPQDYLALGQERLEELTRTIGLYRAKSRSIIGLCRQLLERHHGQVPDRFADLVALPGVGVKTANVVLNVGFGQPVIAVDTHIFRVANRTGLACAKTPEAAGQLLMRRTPPQYLRDAHHYLLLHGRYTCTARNPKCGICPIAGYCRAHTVTGKDSTLCAGNGNGGGKLERNGNSR